MKTTIIIFTLIIFLFYFNPIKAQQIEYTPNLSKIKTEPNWQIINRDVTINEYVSLNGQAGDGMVYINDFDFVNGTIEFDVKGKNDPGRSFVGLAFHIQNDSTFDAIYFRPFNFKNPVRNKHSVQYISMPKFNWYNLRQDFPGKYENVISPVPEPEDWFHAKIVIDYPKIQVFINHSKKASLEVEQIRKKGKGKVGFWVGNGSEGCFRNLKISCDVQKM